MKRPIFILFLALVPLLLWLRWTADVFPHRVFVRSIKQIDERYALIERRCHEDRYEMFRSLTLRYRVLDRQTGLSYALPQSTQVNFQPATVLANGQIASFQSPVTIGSNYTLVLHTPA